MWNCPVCDRTNDTPLCTGCGFDKTRDYARFPTFGPVRGAASVSGLRARRAPKDALRCEKCGSTAFTFRIPDGTRQCQRCGWTPDPAPRLECSCGNRYFTVRMSDHALMCPLCAKVIPLQTLLPKPAEPKKAPAEKPAPSTPSYKPVGPQSVSQPPKKSGPVIKSIAAGSAHTVALYSNGTVRAIGSNADGQCDVSAWKNITAIAAGDSCTIGLKKDGTCLVAGPESNYLSSLYEQNRIRAVAEAYGHRVLLYNDGKVNTLFKVYSSHSTSVECLYTGRWTDITAVAAGKNHTVGLKKDGTVLATGSREDRRCDVDRWTGITAIAAGRRHTVGLKRDGTLIWTGTHDRISDLGRWKDITAIAAGTDFTVGLKKDGTLVVCGTDPNGACSIQKLMTP